MKSLLLLTAIFLTPDFPVVSGYHAVVDPDGVMRFQYYQVTPYDAPTGWVRDDATGERVWWRWYWFPCPHYVIYRDRP